MPIARLHALRTFVDHDPLPCAMYAGVAPAVDGVTDVTDMLEIIGQWGSDDSAADINNDGVVNVTDLLEVVGNWGPCE